MEIIELAFVLVSMLCFGWYVFLCKDIFSYTYIVKCNEKVTGN